MNGRLNRGNWASYWPEVAITACWMVLFLATDLVFRDDESIAHKTIHAGLWLTLACYVALALRAYRTNQS